MHETALAETLHLLGGFVLICGTLAAPYLKILTGSWPVFFLTLLGSVFAGILLLALGAIIQLLQQTAQQLKQLSNQTP